MKKFLLALLVLFNLTAWAGASKVWEDSALNAIVKREGSFV